MEALKTYFLNEMPSIITKKHNRKTYRYVPYNIKTLDNGTYSCEYVLVAPEKFTYGGVVDSIIGIKYGVKETLAIINNYLFDKEDENVVKEFEEFQKWRQFAKENARIYFNN